MYKFVCLIIQVEKPVISLIFVFDRTELWPLIYWLILKIKILMERNIQQFTEIIFIFSKFYVSKQNLYLKLNIIKNTVVVYKYSFDLT